MERAATRLPGGELYLLVSVCSVTAARTSTAAAYDSEVAVHIAHGCSKALGASRCQRMNVGKFRWLPAILILLEKGPRRGVRTHIRRRTSASVGPWTSLPRSLVISRSRLHIAFDNDFSIRTRRCRRTRVPRHRFLSAKPFRVR